MKIAPNYGASDLAHLVHPLTDHSRLGEVGPLVIAEGSGCELVTADGQRLIDGMAGLWTVNLGHGREDLDDVLCLAPPFTISEEQMGRAVETLADSIEATADLHP